MKTALITTTINVPSVLALYRKLDPSVRIFVAADLKTPPEAEKFCLDLENCNYLSPEYQRSRNYACSELIGWNSIQRRNIALLEALRWGADVIVSVDDDNIPMSSHYCHEAQWPLIRKYDGRIVTTTAYWFDVGQLLDPVAPHRGFPFEYADSLMQLGHVTNAKVGVAAGICLGDPDISAVTRIANRPTVHRVSELLRAGIVVDPNTWTVFNSQNTAIIRELAPAWMMWPGVGRCDDIMASLVVQRIARARGYHVHFGQPFVWQQRNTHDLVKDLKAETWGMDHIVPFANWLDTLSFDPDQSVLEMLTGIFIHLPNFVPSIVGEVGLAWIGDLTEVMG